MICIASTSSTTALELSPRFCSQRRVLLTNEAIEILWKCRVLSSNEKHIFPSVVRGGANQCSIENALSHSVGLERDYDIQLTNQSSPLSYVNYYALYDIMVRRSARAFILVASCLMASTALQMAVSVQNFYLLYESDCDLYLLPPVPIVFALL